MIMRELLRIEMSAAQVKEACAQWAYCRTMMNSVESDTSVSVDAGTGCAKVVFSKKRAPRAKNLSNRVIAALQERLIEPAEGAP